MQEATKMETGLMDKKIRTYTERQAANKRKFEDTSRNNQGRKQPLKRQDVARAFAAGSGNRPQKLLIMSAGNKDISKGYCPKLKNNNKNHEGSEDFVAYCDASIKGLGAMLMQRDKVISYASRQLKIHEKNYTTH
nr:putative reverse transcriptase domain-containing protein [Tanacetum cinerariifolium]